MPGEVAQAFTQLQGHADGQALQMNLVGRCHAGLFGVPHGRHIVAAAETFTLPSHTAISARPQSTAARATREAVLRFRIRM